MKTFFSSLGRILVSLFLISQPWGAVGIALAESGSENAAPSQTENQPGTTNAASAEDAPPALRQSSAIMRGVVLPKNSLTMDFQDADVRDVLHLLAIKSGLNIIYGADVTGPISLHLDRVPFDQAFQTIMTLKNLVALPMGPRVIRVISSATLTSEQSLATTFTRVFRLNYADANEVKKPIDAIRTAAGRKGVSTTDTKTNSLIITDTVEGLKEAEDLIPVLDRKPQQVDIEAKIVEVTLDNSSSMGISWSFARTAGGGNAYGSSTSGFGKGSDPNSVTNIPLGPANQGTGVNLFTGDAQAAARQSGFSFIHGEAAYLLSAQLTALASTNRLKILSTPHVVTTNNEEANIQVVTKTPYISGSTSSSAIGAGNAVSQFTTTVSFVDAGIKLTVKPTVNADRRITLKVHPEVSNPTQSVFVGGAPTINTREATTTVVLRDGETIAIGGLITESSQKIVVGVPLLMNIPILGYLFKTNSNVKSRTELIVFLTPKIAAE